MSTFMKKWKYYTTETLRITSENQFHSQAKIITRRQHMKSRVHCHRHVGVMKITGLCYGNSEMDIAFVAYAI